LPIQSGIKKLLLHTRNSFDSNHACIKILLTEGKVVLSPQLSNLKSDDLTAIDTFISDYSHEIDNYFT